MTSSRPEASSHAEVAIVGAGIIGLFNALQFAKRGFRVTLIDDFVGRKESFKVGESLLIFSNMFLRTVGGLDDFLRASVPKNGVWFTYGAEGLSDFEATSEWALERTLPQEWKDPWVNPFLYRAEVEDAQIVRPEAEAEMVAQVRAHPGVTFLDHARVTDVELAEGDRPHVVRWASRSTGTVGDLAADWVLDCSGRVRLLAKRFGHRLDDRELTDGFQTTAVWAQLSDVPDDLFGEAWRYRFPDSGSVKRQGGTLHLWGDGYWIWVIKLTRDRISIGVTFDQRKPPPGGDLREQFWNAIRSQPVFDGILSEDKVLEFRAYRNVQYMTDTFVSRRRYGMVGDAASIIDAYYSQGMSHSFVASWHLANIVEQDLRQGRMDGAYVDRVNEAMRQDYRMMRNMMRGKFTAAIADSRFFLLSHLLDMILFIAIGTPRHQIARWLVETECSTANERPVHRAMRRYLGRRLFYSRSFPPLSPRRVQALQGYLQRVIAERALWRRRHGVDVPSTKCIVRFNAGLIPFWRVFGKRPEARLDLSPDAIAGAPPKWLAFTGEERFPLALKLANALTIATFLGLFVYDGLATGWARVRLAARGVAGSWRLRPLAPGAALAQPVEAVPPTGPDADEPARGE